MNTSINQLSGYYSYQTPEILFIIEDINQLNETCFAAVSLLGYTCYVVPWYAIETNSMHHCTVLQAERWQQGNRFISYGNTTISPQLLWVCYPMQGKALEVLLTLKENNPDALINYNKELSTFFAAENNKAAADKKKTTASARVFCLAERLFPVTCQPLSSTVSITGDKKENARTKTIHTSKPVFLPEAAEGGSDSSSGIFASKAESEASRTLEHFFDNGVLQDSQFSNQLVFALTVTVNFFETADLQAVTKTADVRQTFVLDDLINTNKLDAFFQKILQRMHLPQQVALPLLQKKATIAPAMFQVQLKAAAQARQPKKKVLAAERNGRVFNPVHTNGFSKASLSTLSNQMASVSNGSDAANYPAHPYALLHPVIGNHFCNVPTKAWPGASFEYVHESLKLKGQQGESADAGTLLVNLGRVIDYEQPDGPAFTRFVEPGVGRSVLTNDIVISRQEAFQDFSVLGVGLTPYSKEGYAMVGPYVDGLTSVKRALHRHACAQRLHEAGCRPALTAAIIALPNLETTMPDYSKEPAALLVRGFRSVFRVKQLDPLASLYLSRRHRPFITQFIADERWNGYGKGTEQEEELMIRNCSLNYGATTQSLRNIVGSMHFAGNRNANAGEKAFLKRRNKIIQSYAPLLIQHAKEKLAAELGRNPETEQLSNTAYVKWFCETLGYQVGLFKKLKFLHDYHHNGTQRAAPGWIYTLCETNVSLLAEFPDLDTAIFTDKEDEETLDRLRITSAEFSNLQNNFDTFHLTDVREAESVAMTFARITLKYDQPLIDEAMYLFTKGYVHASTKKIYKPYI